MLHNKQVYHAQWPKMVPRPYPWLLRTPTQATCLSSELEADLLDYVRHEQDEGCR